ncbi:Alpha/Beta hydrolase protein [Pavlovales sp. CCMP2436]|nr:Alpha/Beta hydrolase protein [Pavlovales sp. CCMP2436]
MFRADARMIEPSVEYVHALIRREVARGVPADRIVVGGFSQGGLIAVRAALSFPDSPLGGALALSTFFGSDDALISPPNAQLKLFVPPPDVDKIVPQSEGRRVAERVSRLAVGTTVQLKVYPQMAHATCPDEVLDLRTFMESVMAAGGDGTADAPPTPPESGPKAPSSPPLDPAEVTAMSTGELKLYLKARGLPTADCFERADLLERALGAR